MDNFKINRLSTLNIKVIVIFHSKQNLEQYNIHFLSKYLLILLNIPTNRAETVGTKENTVDSTGVNIDNVKFLSLNFRQFTFSKFFLLFLITNIAQFIYKQ